MIFSLLCRSICFSIFISVSPEAASETPKQKLSDHFSLFYTDEELMQQEAKKQTVPSDHSLHKIHLQALFYSNAHTWTLWINGHQLSSMTPQSVYKIRHVTLHHVILDWCHGGKIHHIQLQPNQSYDALSGQVFEGS